MWCSNVSGSILFSANLSRLIYLFQQNKNLHNLNSCITLWVSCVRKTPKFTYNALSLLFKKKTQKKKSNKKITHLNNERLIEDFANIFNLWSSQKNIQPLVNFPHNCRRNMGIGEWRKVENIRYHFGRGILRINYFQTTNE